MRSTTALAAGAAALLLSACGGGSASSRASASAPAARSATQAGTTVSTAASRPKPPPPAYPRLLAGATGSGPTGFVPAVSWRGQTAAWVARSAAGVALMSFDQQLLGLRLHSGTIDAGSSGWRFGPSVVGAERRRLVAAFNGGFKFSTGAGGFMS